MNIDDELLAAYLNAELSSSDETLLEQRLAAEPALARRLDRLVEVRAVLQGLDAEELPAGAEARLEARLAAARANATAPPVDLSAERARRRPSFSGLATAAAAVAAVAVVGGVALQGLGGGGGAGESADMALEEQSRSSAEAGSAEGGAAGPEESAATGQTSGSAPALSSSEAASADAGEDTFDQAETRMAREAPPVIKTSATLDDAQGVRRRYADRQAYAQSKSSVDLARDATPPPCIGVIDTTATIELIEQIRFDGTPAVAYILRSAGERQAVVVATSGCNSLAVVALE